MTYRSRNYTTAWLGLIAMWLVVFAPLVCQRVVAAHANEPVAALCSAVQPHGAAHQASPDALSACGYCTLLAHHVPAPTLPPALLSVTVLVMLAATRLRSIRFTPLGAFPSGRPRDPPRSSQTSL
ncbi:MAG: DUF2946 domain-containing protein [Janthinobacterium lividum]